MKDNAKLKNRIWELDAFRGICILCVIAVHTLFDLISIFGQEINLPDWFIFVQQNGGVLFIVLSGICVTLGHRSLVRGAVVFGCGMLITAATWFCEHYFEMSEVMIFFGILHLLGICMILYPVYKKFPLWLTAIIGAGIVMAGYIVENMYFDIPLGFVIGLNNTDFFSADYFPLLPHLGWFMLGTVLGRTVYKNKTSLFPRFPKNFFLIRFFAFCGRQSLWIYLGHQPIVFGILYLIFMRS